MPTSPPTAAAVPSEEASLWSAEGKRWRDPLPERALPVGWAPSLEGLASRRERSEKRAEAYSGRIGTGVLSKRIR